VLLAAAHVFENIADSVEVHSEFVRDFFKFSGKSFEFSFFICFYAGLSDVAQSSALASFLQELVTVLLVLV